VAGTAPIAEDGSPAAPGDLYAQTKRCLEITRKAIEEAGGELSGVYRTRILLKDVTSWKEAARAHGEVFGGVRPACTMVEISRLIDEEWLVETEADCWVGGE
jgi:enamine deaminase RidA (YjgF/YER057c/UK114 family)